MATYPAHVDIRHRVQYPPKPTTGRRLAMTIAVGMCCQDGLVLSADRQMTAAGSHKYQEDKIYQIYDGDSLSEAKWKVYLTYAGSPGLMTEVRERLTRRL